MFAGCLVDFEYWLFRRVVGWYGVVSAFFFDPKMKCIGVDRRNKNGVMESAVKDISKFA